MTVAIPRSLPSFHVEGEAPAEDSVRSRPEPRVKAGDSARDSGDEASAKGGDDPAFTNVFLNVGRRDGLRVEDVQKLVVDKGGLSESDVGHIRLRDRITFVGIRKEHSERAIKGLIGAVVGDRTVNAEPARDR